MTTWSGRIYNLFILALLIFFIQATLTACSSDTGAEQNKEGWAQRPSELEFQLSFAYANEWNVTGETNREGVRTFLYEKKVGQDSILMVAAVLPLEYEKDQLEAESIRLLTAGLHETAQVEPFGSQRIGKYDVSIISAEAGHESPVKAESAAFVYRGRSYIFTLITSGTTNADLTAELEKIIATLVIE